MSKLSGMRKRLLCLLSSVLVLAAVVAAAAPVGARPARASGPTAGPPTDYGEVKGLSKARFETVRQSHMVEMEDGITMYVEVVRPKGPGRYGTILELSPYHGTLADRSGTRILPGPKNDKGEAIGLTGYFAPRGYAVVMADLRGTGRSQGCLDHLGPKDQSDAFEIVEWAADQKWSNGRVGMTGHSYVGSTPQMAAAQNPPHLETIVPSAGLAAMYHHEFQMGVPYAFQWLGPLFAYEALAIGRHLPPQVPGVFGDNGDNFGNDMQYFGCGAPNSAAVTGESYVSGAEEEWHRERDYRKGATKAEIPTFVVHGVNDNAARIAALDWFHARNGRPGDKAWIGQWDHGSGRFPNSRTCLQEANEPCVDDQWTKALHAWFDKHLLRRNVDTGPPLEAFLNNGEVYTAPQWPPRTDDITFHASGDGTLTAEPGNEEGGVSYVADPNGFASEFDTGSVVFETPKFTKDTLVIGIPEMRLTASVTSPRIHLIATLYDDDGKELDRIGMADFAIQPELRNGIDEPAPVIPGEVMKMDLEGMAQAHLIEKGHRLTLIVASSHPDKVPTLAAGARVTVVTGGKGATSVTLPVIENPKLYRDPFVPAQ